ncbi:Ig-like domain-containing protein, partial [Flavobacterium bizetiae]
GTQNFCLVNAPTFASVQFNETNIVWYTALTGGTGIPSTTALTSGTYYAAIKDPTTSCESITRLTVTINVNDPGTPTLVTAGTQNFCLVNAPTFASVQFNQANIVWYTALTGGTGIPSTTALTSGTYYAAISDPTTGCESAVRLSVTISVTDPGTPTLVTAGTQNFCLVNAPTFASVQFNQANIVWYTALTGGTEIPSTTALTSGTYYAALKDATTGCESSVRLAVTINVNDPGTPTLVTAGTQNFCLVNAPTFASVQFNQANIVWYTALTGGTAIASTTALTSGTYYAAISDPTSGCESAVRLTVTINVSDPGTPTLVTAGTQNFCLVNAPTFASVQFNQTNIVWYTALTGGTGIPSTTALTSGTYYAAINDPASGCESAVRLAVTISITDPGTPTLVTAGTQNFCFVNVPTFASVQFNQTNIIWYTALTGGTAIPSTTALTSGTYYAALKDAATGCESSARLTVTVNVTDPVTPTTANASQTFCSENNPTVANIQVNETNVVWYSAATGGTPISATTVLVSGDYFAALKDASTGCESSIRLKVTVTVGGSNVPTTNNAAQNFCSTSAPTFASIQVNESNVSWFNGATGGTAIPLTTALTSGIYYGEITNPLTGCKSATRLPVTITIVNPMPTPTTTSSTQNFCSVNAPKVSNIQVNESNVIWYSTATGGTAIPATTALANGTYYGVVASGSGCENPLRLQVIVNVNTPGIVTTPRVNQTFCLSAAPTIESIVVNEANVIWYTSANGGTPLAANTPLTASTYYASVLNNTTNGCEGATRLGVTISFENDALVPITTTDDTPCVFQGVTYSIANGKSDYIWTVQNGTITSGGGNADGTVTISWSDIGPGKVNVTYINTCNEKTTKSLNVNVATCSDLTITNTVSNPTPNFGEQITFTVTVNNVGEGNFINTIVSELLPSGFDLISASTTAGTYDLTTQLWTIPTLNAGQSVVLTIVAEVLPSGNYTNVATVEISTPLDVDTSNNSASVTVVPVCLTVYNEFTPNNDGANDLFRIDCIESYPNNELKVYNRYGSLVYSKQHYENDWDGTANVSGVINRGDMLPTGTYFYVITIGDGTVKKGWLSIMR